MFNSLWPHGLEHTRLPCPSPSPRACSNSCPLSWWCHSTVSSSVIHLSSCLKSFPASGSFPMIQLFASHGQSTGASASASVLPMKTEDWLLLGLTGLISLLSKKCSRVFSNTTVWRHQRFGAQPFLLFSSHIHITTGKTIADYMDLCRKIMCQLFNTLSRFVIAFLPIPCCFYCYTLYFNLKLETVMPPDLFLFLRIALAIHSCCGSIQVLGFSVLFLWKNVNGILIGISLNMHIMLSNMEIFAKLILPIHEHRKYFYFGLFFNFFQEYLNSFECTIFHILS